MTIGEGKQEGNRVEVLPYIALEIRLSQLFYATTTPAQFLQGPRRNYCGFPDIAQKAGLAIVLTSAPVYRIVIRSQNRHNYEKLNHEVFHIVEPYLRHLQP